MFLDLLGDDLIVHILSFFQGYGDDYVLIEKAQNCDSFEFSTMMRNQRTLLINLKTDLKSILNLSSVNRRFYNLIRESEITKPIWVAHYNSLFPMNIEDNSVHIGEQSWIKCSNYLSDLEGNMLKFPGIDRIREEICTSEGRCWNPLHYINQKSNKIIKISNQELFKKIAVKTFNLYKHEAPDFTSYHERRLNNLKDKQIKIDKEIKILERRKNISKMELDKIFKPWLNEKQLKSYFQLKNQLSRINDETTSTTSEESVEFNHGIGTDDSDTNSDFE